MRFRIRYAQQIVGFFLLAGLLSLVIVLVLMGLNQRWFAKNFTFYTRFQSASGITEGMSIKLKGFEIGKVSEMHLNSHNRVTVTVQIYEEFYDRVRPDSVIEAISSPIGLAGEMNLLPGKNTLPPIEEFSFIPSTDTIFGKSLLTQKLVDKPEGNEAINGIIAQIEPLLSEVRNTAAGVNQLLTNINGAVDGSANNQVTTLLQNINKTLRTVDNVLATTGGNTNTLLVSSQTLLKNINAITGDVETLTSQMKDPTGLIPKLLDPKGSMKTLLDDNNSIFNQITQILNQVNSTMKEVRSLAVYLNQSTPQISGIMEDTKTTLKKTSDVMEGLSNNPLLKGGIPEKKPQSSTFRSIRDEEF